MGVMRLKLASTALAAVLLVSLLTAVAGGVQAEGAEISLITDRGLDANGDGAFEALVIEVTVEAPETGSAYVHAELHPVDLGISHYFRGTLEAGTHTVEFQFTEGELQQTGETGEIKVAVSLNFNGLSQGSHNHQTAYTLDDFAAPSPDDGVANYEWRGGDILIQYDVIQVEFDTNEPRLTFYYADDSGENAKFAVEYTELIAYDDIDGDGALDPSADDVLASASLADVDWEESLFFKTMADEQILTGIMLEGLVPLEFDAGTVGFVELTFFYPIHLDEDFNTPSQRKFDITLDFPEPLDADRVCLRHIAADLTGGHTFQEVSSDDDKVRMEFVDTGSGDLHGYYEWTRSIEIDSSSGPSTDEVAATSTEEADGRMVIEFNYPARGIDQVYHDPAVGVNPDISFAAVLEALGEILHHPATYVVALVVAIVLVLFSFARKRKK